MLLAKNWTDYELLDMGDGMKVERFGDYIFKRVEPNAKGHLRYPDIKPNAVFENGKWTIHSLPLEWHLQYQEMTLSLSLSTFKHLGVFPEQASNWDFIRAVDKTHTEPLKILNLFAYTGASTVMCAMGNVDEVVHIDALKSAIKKTQENLKLNHLEDKKVRTIVEDAIKFLQREKKRGNKYHAILMDPPSFGRGPNKEIWKIEDKLETLFDLALDVLSEDAVYFIVNTYSTHLPHSKVEALLKKKFKEKNIYHGSFSSDELGIPLKDSHDILALGNTTRWCIYDHLL